MNTIVTFGEIMMRLNPKGFLRLLQVAEYEATFAGCEANVAVSLANFGMDAAFVCKLPDNDIGQSAVNELRRFGVNTSHIRRGGPRLGIYFVEKGASQRSSKVIYDRKYSSIALAEKADFDWGKILEGANWFHFSGITPALGPNLPEICMEACKTAKAMGATVSCDLNYRKKLWAREQACSVMSELMPYVDVCIANEEDARDVFGIESKGTDVEKGKINEEGYISVAEQLEQRFGCKIVAITLRGSISASVNEWAGMLYTDGKAYFSPRYCIQIVDRVGGGDSFGAALIYALTNHYDPQNAINFAAAASCLKHTIEHDFNLVSLQDVEALVAGNASGRVQR